MEEHARGCCCSQCDDTRKLRRDVQRLLDRARGVDSLAEPVEAPVALFLHFKCQACRTEHRLSGNRVAGLRRFICSVCGATWKR